MAKILIGSVPIHGHVSPGLPIARALVERGHEVIWYTGERYRYRVQATGAEFRPWVHAPDFDDSDMDAAFPGRAKLRGMAKLKFDIMQTFIRPAAGQYRDLRDILSGFAADVMLCDPAFMGMAPLVMSGDAPPAAVYGILPLTLNSRDTAPFGLGLQPGSGLFSRMRNRLLNRVVERGVFGEVQRYADEVLKSIGMPRLPHYVLDAPARMSSLFLQGTCPSFEYPRSDLPPQVRFIGPILPEPPAVFEPPAWWHELRAGRPVVHVTQGTLANEDFRRLVVPTLEALAGEDVLVVASLGGKPLDRLGIQLPANARVSEYLSYHHFLPHVDCMVTNGGYGGVHMAMQYGVPLVAAGSTEDKPEVCARVAWAGVGINLGTDKPSREQLRRAVRNVLDEPEYKGQAVRMHREFEQYDSIRTACALLEQLAVKGRSPGAWIRK